MRTFALQILCCLSLGILGLHAATRMLAPVQVTQTGYFQDMRGDVYLLTTSGSTSTIVKVLITSDEGVIPVERKFLIVLVGTPKQAATYLERRGATQ